MPVASAPPLDGSVPIFPHHVDYQAEVHGESPWAVFPSTSSAMPLSFLEFANATHRIAHTFRPCKTDANGEVVGIIVHCDTILYIALVVGLIRAGFVPFPMAPKNSAAAYVDMLQRTSCHCIITQPMFQPVVNTVRSKLEANNFILRVEELPALGHIFPRFCETSSAAMVESFPPISRTISSEDIVVYLHSSGSTGFPKPIPQRHRAMIQWCSASSVMNETRKRAIRWGLMALPTFHVLGFYTQLCFPILGAQPIALFSPRAPDPPVLPTPNVMLDACKTTGSTGIVIVPAFIEAWAQSDEDVRFLSTLQILAFAGAPLSEQSGRKLVNAGVPLYAGYGTTECPVHTMIFDNHDSQDTYAGVKTSADWDWLTFPDYLERRWIPQGDGTFELQLLTCEGNSPAVENLSDTRGYATGDLFVPHSTKRGLWKIIRRKDDVVVLATGEKVVPISQESHIAVSPMIAGAVMFGHGRNNCGVLIEAHPQFAVDQDNPAAVAGFRNEVWPVVEEANQLGPASAQIYKEMILVVDPKKPLPRAAKGSVIRPRALKLYEDEINNLYIAVENSAVTVGIAQPRSWISADIEPWLRQQCASLSRGREVPSDRDIFEHGFDSLQATFLRNRILGTLRSCAEPDIRHSASRIPWQTFVYDHPTLRGMAGALEAMLTHPPANPAKDAKDDIQRMLSTYAQHLPKPACAKLVTSSMPIVVLVTGTTGTVGSHILAALLREPKIWRMYTLNRSRRSTPVAARQAQSFLEKGIPVELLDDRRLVQLAGDVTLERFGLEADYFEELKGHVTHIVHNAWRVDFNLSLESFESYIAGTRRIIDLCCVTPHPVKLLFTSSASAVQGWDASNGQVPEEVLSDPTIGVGSGYGASKFIAENLLYRAAENGVQCISLRVGQVCGPRDTGAWSTSEWVPMLVKSSVAIGKIPDLDGVVSWIPVDAVGLAVRDLVARQDCFPSLLNVVHPHPVAWHKVFDHINASLSPKVLTIVPATEWLQELERVAARSHTGDWERIPILKILDFMRKVVARDITTTGSTRKLVEDRGMIRCSSNSGVCQRKHWKNSVKHMRRLGLGTGKSKAF